MKATEFDIFEMAKGTTYPEDSVMIYTDNATAYKIRQIDDVLNSPLKYETSDEEAAQLEKDRAELVDTLNESRVEIVMQGIPERKIQELRDQQGAEFGIDVFPPERLHKWQITLLQKSLRKAISASGQEQNLENQDYDKVATWFISLPRESQERLDKLVARLSMSSDYFENAEITSDF